MRAKWVIAVISLTCILVILAILLTGIYEAIKVFIMQYWITLLTFTLSAFSLCISVLTYYNKVKPNLKVCTNNKWVFELESEDLNDGTVTAVIVSRQGTAVGTEIENSGGSATTLKTIEVSKKNHLLCSSSAEIVWRRDYHLFTKDPQGNLVPLSIWDRIEPGQRVIVLLPYTDILDVLARNKMLNLNQDEQGKFFLTFTHVFAQAKSTGFQLMLSGEVRKFIQERMDAFGCIIVGNSDRLNPEGDEEE